MNLQESTRAQIRGSQENRRIDEGNRLGRIGGVRGGRGHLHLRFSVQAQAGLPWIQTIFQVILEQNLPISLIAEFAVD